MEQTGVNRAIGRRNFITTTTLLGGGAGMALLEACSERPDPLSLTLIQGRKWVQAVAFDSHTGVFTSLDGFTDNPESFLDSDVEFSGYAVHTSGEIVSVTEVVDKDTAGLWSLSAQGGDLYHLKVDGVVQPPGGPAYEVHLVERVIPGTAVTVFTGYSYDPTTSRRVLLGVSHDPILPVVIVVLVILAFPLIANAPPPDPHDQGGGQ